MSLENYYTIEKEETLENKAVYKIALNTNHNMYQGHFPEFPLLPGAVQIEMIQELLEKSLDSKLNLKTAKNIKYLGMINPSQHSNLLIDLQWNEDETIKLKATIKSLAEEGKIMLKYSAEYYR
jgi:3-hydroxyacyl-[acyl-carrier-protein] dehydratase